MAIGIQWVENHVFFVSVFFSSTVIEYFNVILNDLTSFWVFISLKIILWVHFLMISLTVFGNWRFREKPHKDWLIFDRFKVVPYCWNLVFIDAVEMRGESSKLMVIFKSTRDSVLLPTHWKFLYPKKSFKTKNSCANRGKIISTDLEFNL